MQNVKLKFFKINCLDFILIALISILFFTYFSSNTESEYSRYPNGDAVTYTLMALHFDSPHQIKEKLPIIYSQRFFPSFLTFLLAKNKLKKFSKEIENISAQDDIKKSSSIPVNQIIFAKWKISNFIAYFLQLYFIFLILSYYSFDGKLKYFFLIIYSMWFIPIRLYIDWVQMADPWAFTFIASSVYFLLNYNPYSFFISILLGTMCKEILLFFIPTFIWITILKNGLNKKSFFYISLNLIPVIAFILWRKYPYFPSSSQIHGMKLSNNTNWITEYIFLLQYHFFYRINCNSLYFLDIILIPLSVFGGLSYFLIWHFKDSYYIIKKEIFWMPYILLVALIGINVDRYIFYIFPMIIIFSAYILHKNYHNKNLSHIMCFLILITIIQHEVWRFFPLDNNHNFILKHQLEIVSNLEYLAHLAKKYRLLILKTSFIAFIGFFFLEKYKSKGISTAKFLKIG